MKLQIKRLRFSHTLSKLIKTFWTVGTQTEDLHEQGTTATHPDDINELLHLEDHCYSLGPNKDSLTSDNKDIVEPCRKPCTTVSVEKLPLVECDDDQIEVNVESTKQVCSNDADDDSSDGSSYSPSASDDSETDEELSSDTAASVEKKFIVFECQLLKLFKLFQYCGSPTDTTTQKN